MKNRFLPRMSLFAVSTALIETILLLLAVLLVQSVNALHFLFWIFLGCLLPSLLTGAYFASQCRPSFTRGRIASRTASACLPITFICLNLYVVWIFYQTREQQIVPTLTEMLCQAAGSTLFASLTAAFLSFIMAHAFLALSRHAAQPPATKTSSN